MCSVKPRKGDALLFFSLHPDASTDEMSLHGGCPVLEGEKWSATKWIHVASFDKVYGNTGNCTDNNDSCGRWAALGECTKNPEYMVGTPDLPGYCRRSCNVCWAAADHPIAIFSILKRKKNVVISYKLFLTACRFYTFWSFPPLKRCIFISENLTMLV